MNSLGHLEEGPQAASKRAGAYLMNRCGLAQIKIDRPLSTAGTRRSTPRAARRPGGLLDLRKMVGAPRSRPPPLDRARDAEEPGLAWRFQPEKARRCKRWLCWETMKKTGRSTCFELAPGDRKAGYQWVIDRTMPGVVHRHCGTGFRK